MKKIIVTVFMFLSVIAYSADNKNDSIFTQNGKEFVQTTKSKSKSGGTENNTGCTWTDSKGIKYNIYMSSKGRCYIYKVSKNTGKKYKYYLPKEIDERVAAQMNNN